MFRLILKGGISPPATQLFVIVIRQILQRGVHDTISNNCHYDNVAKTVTTPPFIYLLLVLKLSCINRYWHDRKGRCCHNCTCNKIPDCDLYQMSEHHIKGQISVTRSRVGKMPFLLYQICQVFNLILTLNF